MGICITEPSLRWDIAIKAVQAATCKAQALDILINVAVVDRAGHTLACARMNGAFLHATEIASDKAYTAASFGFPTSDWMPLLDSSPALRHGLVQRPRLVVFAGGLPIILEGTCIGGIGVSGGSEAEDVLCAQAALETVLSLARD